MFLAILDLVIGLIFIYFVLSIAASSIMESITRWKNIRARNLQQWLRDSFDKKVGDKSLGELIGEHGLIQKLTLKGRLPSYIPPDIFSKVLLEIVHAEQNSPVKAYNLKSLKTSIEKTDLLPDDIKRSWLQNLEECEDDIDEFRNSIATWFDDSMVRLGGRFKKYTQSIILIISLILAVFLNIDTFQLAEFLYENPEARASLVEASQKMLQDSVYQKSFQSLDSVDKNIDIAEELMAIKKEVQKVDSLQQSLIDLKLPIGWPLKAAALTQPCEVSIWVLIGSWLKKIGGWVITGFAVSLGAPFWFETLNKLVNLRGSGATPVLKKKQ